jgi:hypothetical protein
MLSFHLPRDEFPRLAQVDLKRVITDLIEEDADPPTRADIRRFEIGVRRIVDQQRLKAGSHRQPYRKAAIFMMVVHK